jgi:hypothetical protein
MRSCLIQLLLTAAVIFALLWFGLPFGASWLATNALGAVGFSGTDTTVEVKADLPPRILTGYADSIRLTSTQVGVGDLHAANIDLTLGDVELFARKIGTVRGTLGGVRVPDPDGQPVTFETVNVDGDARHAASTLTISNAEVTRLAVSQLKAHGITGTVAFSAPDKVVVTAGGKPQACRLRVTNGALTLVPDGNALPTLTLIAPGGGNPFQLSSVSVAATSFTLVATIDLQTLLGI